MPDTSPLTVFSPLPPASTRGTVRILVGRGESAAVYDRFARRLASDGYLVYVGNSTDVHPDASENVSPTILIGVDTGILDAVRLVNANPDASDALVLVGIPGTDDPTAPGWPEEITARASCPTQQRRLREDTIVTPDSLVPQHVPAIERLSTEIPVLALHGVDDTISPLALAEPRYRALGHVRLKTVTDGRHDVLNSIHHRSVAAAVVTFLEEVRVDRSGHSTLLHELVPESATDDRNGETR